MCVCVCACVAPVRHTDWSEPQKEVTAVRCNASNARHKHLTSTHSARSNALALRGRSTRGLGAAPPTRGEKAARLTALSTVHWAGLGWCTRWARLAKRRRGAQLSSGGGGSPPRGVGSDRRRPSRCPPLHGPGGSPARAGRLGGPRYGGHCPKHLWTSLASSAR